MNARILILALCGLAVPARAADERMIGFASQQCVVSGAPIGAASKINTFSGSPLVIVCGRIDETHLHCTFKFTDGAKLAGTTKAYWSEKLTSMSLPGVSALVSTSSDTAIYLNLEKNRFTYVNLTINEGVVMQKHCVGVMGDADEMVK